MLCGRTVHLTVGLTSSTFPKFKLTERQKYDSFVYERLLPDTK
jgi:hypothetical protein